MTNLRQYYRLEKVNPYHYDIIFRSPHLKEPDSGDCIASAVQDVDGYWYIQIDNNVGLFDESFFQIGLEVLTDLNRALNEELKRYFESGVQQSTHFGEDLFREI